MTNAFLPRMLFYPKTRLNSRLNLTIYLFSIKVTTNTVYPMHKCLFSSKDNKQIKLIDFELSDSAWRHLKLYE